MKASIPKVRWFTGLISTAILPALLLSPCSVTAAISVVASSDSPPNPPATVQVQFSAGISEILKMVDAKVEGSVIIAYIDSSPTAYNPSASEIIMLKDRGVPSEVIAEMLKHGGEVRARATTSAPPPAAQPYPSAPTPYTENPDYTYPPAYADYGYPSSSVYYYNYGYPYYGYSYPWYGYWPSFYFSFNRFHHFHHRFPFRSFDHFGHFTAFRGTTRFNGGFNHFRAGNGAFRVAGGGTRSSVMMGSHGGFRGGGGFRSGGGFRGGFAAHGGGGGRMGGRAR